MCKLLNTQQHLLASDMKVFKVVREIDGKYYSCIEPSERDAVRMKGYPDVLPEYQGYRGDEVQYMIGEMALAKTPPGLMAYLDLRSARRLASWMHLYRVLEGYAPAGTLVMMAWHEGMPVICAMAMRITDKIPQS